ncbi:MAG: RluA family pseudouridine synthase [Chloroflexi bacterium]|nr:RluA family pseudouridine synthase [Chloroflexota bacterium]MBP7043801.1 RluA family pseudouridine synthase [Chloroflexota bacterium]
MTQETLPDQSIEFTLDDVVRGDRLDHALALAKPDFSRMQWQRLIQEKRVSVNGRITTKTSLRLNGGEQITAVIPPIVDTGLIAEDIPLEICYEDRDILVVNKPAGMVTHPSQTDELGTLVNAILYHYPDLEGIGGERRPGIVHRLDKHTSGLIVVARNDRALWFMQEQFKRRTIQKKYLALVEGQIQPPAALIDAPIGRDPNNRKKMAVIPPNTSAMARSARTRYETVTRFDNFSLVACAPLTGRTHQIRVHLAYIGFPIVCDHIYGRRKKSFADLRRHFLHAAELTFKRPCDNTELTITAELPPELQTIIDSLTASS